MAVDWNFLAWENRWERKLTQETDQANGSYEPFSFPDEDTEVTIAFTISQKQFTQVYSALLKGALLSYPDTSEQVNWYFLRNFEMANSLCQAIADCINDPESPARQAVKDLVVTDPDINNYITNVAGTVLTTSERGQNLLKPDACDPDFLFNQASKLVFLLDQLATDLFQAIEVGTNALERAQAFVSAIPVIGGLLPFDEILSLADNLVSNVSEDYAGAYDQGMYDDLRCGLFCTFKDSCLLSIDEALNYYQGKLGSSLPSNPLETLQAICQFLLTGDIPGDYSVYAMHILAIAAIRAGENLLGIDFGQLGLRITAAGDEPDNDWETLCEDCGVTPTIILVATGIFGIFGSTTFMGFDDDGNDIWECGLVENPITPYAVMSVKDSLDRCMKIEAFSGPIIEASWTDCAHVNSGSQPTLIVDQEYLVINAQCTSVSSVITLHLSLA